MRFHAKSQYTRTFELDSPHTQQAKIKQLRKRNLNIPANLVFIEVDFEKESLSHKLDSAGFQKGCRNFFILEGLLMYLEPESVRETFQAIREYAGQGSRVVFDNIQASVLRHENALYGEAGLLESVSKAGAQWRSGLGPSEIASFAVAQCFEGSDNKCANELETTYFQEADGWTVGRVIGTHCIATVERV